MHKTLTALALALLLPFASGLHAADKAERELRYSEFGPNRGARAEALMWFDEQLRERTGNQLGLNIVWGGALLSAKNSMQGVSKIAADMASAYSGYEPGILVAYEVANAVQSTDEWGGLNAVYKFMTSNEAALAEQESNQQEKTVVKEKEGTSHTLMLIFHYFSPLTLLKKAESFRTPQTSAKNPLNLKEQRFQVALSHHQP